MPNDNYIYDGKEIKFKKADRTVSGMIGRALKYVLASVSLAVLYYAVFALFFSTDTERLLRDENRMLEKVYPEMEKKEALLADVVGGLQARDDEIYNAVFHSPAPSRSRLSSVDFLAVDSSLKDDDIVEYSTRTLGMLSRSTANVEANFRYVFGKLSEEGFVVPPMNLPIKEFTYAMTGASVGDRISPFYKVPVKHNGIDLISPSGTPVYATGNGFVSKVVRSSSSMGNLVEITHDGGYVTRYAHLEDIAVPNGRKVKAGALIGHVGISGQTYAPHLHYEIYKGEEVCDPINYFFGSVGPDEYTNMLVMSVSTGQSMD